MSDAPFFHPQALCESPKVGRRTRVWAFAHVLPGAVIGDDCNLCDHVFVENDVVVGDRVTIKCGVQLWDGVTLGDDVFVGPNATFTNDRFPRSRQYQEKVARTVVEARASIGANATILPGLTIGREAMVGAGAVVTRSVPPRTIVVGNPARIVGYTGVAHEAPVAPASPVQPAPPAGRVELGVGGAALLELKQVRDLRGDLVVGEVGGGLPFVPRRIFLVSGVPSQEVRGEHAHRICHQLLLCVAGSVAVIVDDGAHRREVVLARPGLALHVPPRVWATEYRYSADAVLLVLASEPYDPDDYVREYDAFLSLVGAGGARSEP